MVVGGKRHGVRFGRDAFARGDKHMIHSDAEASSHTPNTTLSAANSRRTTSLSNNCDYALTRAAEQLYIPFINDIL